MNFCSVLYKSVSSSFNLLSVFRRLWLLRSLFKTGLVLRWLEWKQPFLLFLTKPGPTFWPQNAHVKNSQISILVFTWLERQKLLPTLCFFPIFEPNQAKNVTFLGLFALDFHLGVFTTSTSCFKIYSPCKIWKKTYW